MKLNKHLPPSATRFDFFINKGCNPTRGAIIQTVNRWRIQFLDFVQSNYASTGNGKKQILLLRYYYVVFMKAWTSSENARFV